MPIVESNLSKDALPFRQSKPQQQVPILPVLDSSHVNHIGDLVLSNNMNELRDFVSLNQYCEQVRQSRQGVTQEIHEDGAHHRAVGNIPVAADALFGDARRAGWYRAGSRIRKRGYSSSGLLGDVVLQCLDIALGQER